MGNNYYSQHHSTRPLQGSRYWLLCTLVALAFFLGGWVGLLIAAQIRLVLP